MWLLHCSHSCHVWKHPAVNHGWRPIVFPLTFCEDLGTCDYFVVLLWLCEIKRHVVSVSGQCWVSISYNRTLKNEEINLSSPTFFLSFHPSFSRPSLRTARCYENLHVCLCVQDQQEPYGKEPTVETLQKKVRRLELELENRAEMKNEQDDRGKVGTSVQSTLDFQSSRQLCHLSE